MAVDMDKLNAFIGQFVGDLGAAVHAGMVVIGERLGLYKALASGPMTSAELAAKTGTDERYVREWLASQAAGGYITYDEKTDKFSLSEEQAFTLANEDSPAYLPGAFQLALGALNAVPRIADSFRSGAGMGWHEHDDGVFHGCEKFFRPGYAANLVSSWIPALARRRQEAGSRRACGRRGLRPGRFDHSDGESLSQVPVLRLRLSRQVDSARRASRRRAKAWPIASTSKSPRPRTFPARTMTSWRSSIACTTWAIRWALPGTCASRCTGWHVDDRRALRQRQAER